MPFNAADLKRRVELILEQVDQLPTLSSVALRLLEVTSSENTDADDVIELVSADPSLSARLLQLCRRSHLGVSLEDADVAHAVKLLGFEEVRAAAAAVQVFELLAGLASPGGEMHGERGAVFEPAAFWQHSIAVAILSEKLARSTPLRRTVKPGDAFLGGLIHDLGQLALHTILPRSFDRACEAAEMYGCGIDESCRRIMGVDSHSVGRHLAQHWQLPARLVEVVWLNGEALEATATSSNRDLIRVVTLADLLARRHLLVHAGHAGAPGDIARCAAVLNLDQSALESACARIHDEVAGRAASLGMGNGTDMDVLKQSMERAARLLGRMQAGQARQRAAAQARSRTLRAAALLFESGMPGASLTTAMGAVARSAIAMLGPGSCAIIHVRAGNGIEIFQYDETAAHQSTTQLRPRDGVPALSLDAADNRLTRVTEALPWLDSGCEYQPPADAVALRLACSNDVSAAIIFERVSELKSCDDATRDLLRRMWGSAISSAVMRDRNDDLGERLIATNRQLVSAQDALTRQRAAHAVAEFACGAAHEMNNPLTVMSARAQTLARKLSDGAMRESAEEIVRQAHKLSDLITSLKLAAEAPAPAPQVISMIDVVNDAVRMLRQRAGESCPVRISIEESLPAARLDRAQIAQALRELLQNAQEAHPHGEILVRTEIAREDDRLIISVTDAGPGLGERALEHAFDPFFSEKPAGRQPGLGLARARRLVEANGGQITLRNGPRGAAIAAIHLTSWRAGNSAHSQAA